MRKEFKLLIKKGLKARIKETEGRESIKKSLATELSKGGKQSGELEAFHLPYLDIINKLVNERSIPDSLELPDVSLKH
jgi:hypothetical protein